MFWLVPRIANAGGWSEVGNPNPDTPQKRATLEITIATVK